MIRIKTFDDFYPAVEELIEILKSNPKTKLSMILDHRMHKVVWTTGSELLEELSDVFKKFLASEGSAFDEGIVKQINELISFIDKDIQGRTK